MKDLTEFILALFYYAWLKLKGRPPSRVVIFYHDIKGHDVAGFRRQMAFLSRRYVVVKSSEIMTIDTAVSKPIVAITFDDAFVGVKEHAIPVLEEFRLTAGIFVPAGNLGEQCGWDVRKNFSDANSTVMNTDQILELDKKGFEIFSHSCSHPVLTGLNESVLEAELGESKNVLEGIVGHEVKAISYPYGAFDTRVCGATEKCGYKFGFSVEPSLVDRTTKPLEIGRVSVLPGDSLLKFKLKVGGAYQITKYLRRLKRSLVKGLRL